jgi:hypothetical protein
MATDADLLAIAAEGMEDYLNQLRKEDEAGWNLVCAFGSGKGQQAIGVPSGSYN